MLRLIVVLSILALGACAAPAPPQPAASAAPQAAPESDTRVQRAQSEDGKDVMLLYPDKECPAHILALHRVPPTYTLHLANLTLRDGKQYVGCYLTQAGTVLTIWDDGDVIPLAQGAFQPVSGAAPARTGKLDA